MASFADTSSSLGSIINFVGDDCGGKYTGDIEEDAIPTPIGVEDIDHDDLGCCWLLLWLFVVVVKIDLLDFVVVC